jgi:hypothetical protein
MSAPLTNHIAHGTPEALREFIAENVGLAAIQADLIRVYAELGDDRGLEYGLRHFVAYAKAALNTFADLRNGECEGSA